MLENLTRSIKNIFVGSHKGEDISAKWSHPHDSMPIANGTNKYATPEKMTELEQNPRPEEDIAEDWFESDTYASRHESTPEFEKTAEEVVTMHEKMYRIATSKYNPFSIGGSESIKDFQGGSENIT